MRRAVDELSGVLRPQLQADLDRLSSRAIPVDVAFTQGKSVLGLD